MPRISALALYEPEMACPSGLCSLRPDPELIRIANDLRCLRSRGVTVARYNLGFDGIAFFDCPEVLDAMGEFGEHLPILTVDGVVVKSGAYPTFEELEDWARGVVQVT